MRPELAALVVHDLKNALGALEAELGILAARSSKPSATSTTNPDDGDLARHSHRQCTELRQRFVQFLAVYAAGDQMPAHCSDESPRDLLATLAQASRPTLPPGVVLAIAETGEEPAFWYFDRRLVRMALDAALHNAKRFARQHIELSARGEDGYLVLSVDDDGPGLGEADPLTDSTGLGTTLCESVARAHSTTARTGRVVLKNRPEGGARFELWLG